MTELKFHKSTYSGQDQNCVEVAPVLPVFHKSTYSGQHQECVEVAPIPTDFRKSTYSGQGVDCVEVAPLPAPGAALRDSKYPHLGHLAFPAAEWEAFLAAARRDAL